MAINFPNSPVNGNTYKYQNTIYLFVKPVGASVGYWTVSELRALGAATSADINSGLSSSKYITPLGLMGSKYVTQRSTGETTLKFNNLDRLKTTSTGVQITGQISYTGKMDRNGTQLGISELWSGDLSEGLHNIDLNSDISDYDMIYFTTEISRGLVMNKEVGISVSAWDASLPILIGEACVSGADSLVYIKNQTSKSCDLVVEGKSIKLTRIYAVKLL